MPDYGGLRDDGTQMNTADLFFICVRSPYLSVSKIFPVFG